MQEDFQDVTLACEDTWNNRQHEVILAAIKANHTPNHSSEAEANTPNHSSEAEAHTGEIINDNLIFDNL